MVEPSTSGVTLSGSENHNSEVKKLIEESSIKLKLTRAQIDVDFSNAAAECFFKIFKNRFLYFKAVDTLGNAESSWC